MVSVLRLSQRIFGPIRRCLATHAAIQQKDCTNLTPPYEVLIERLGTVRRGFLGNRPLSLAEKILFAHIYKPEQTLGGLRAGGRGQIRGERYLQLKPARVAMQDASAQ